MNFEFNQRVPIFSAITNKMMKLFDVIVNHKDFDSKIEDGFGETLLESLLYLQGSEEVNTTSEDSELLKSMINSILSSKTFDFNIKDINNDTALNVACEYPSELWVAKDLISRKDIDVNVINDFYCGALSNCIRNNNLEALKLLGQRPDLKVRKEDKELAKECKIDLSIYIKPNDGIFNKEVESFTEDALEYAFAQA